MNSRQNFERDYVLTAQGAASMTPEQMTADWNEEMQQYANVALQLLFCGYKILESANRMRDSELATRAMGSTFHELPTTVRVPHIGIWGSQASAPPGYTFAYTLSNNCLWPIGISTTGIEYSTHDNSGAEYVDIALIQLEEVTQFQQRAADRVMARVRDGFMIKTSAHASEETEGVTLQHQLHRITVTHKEFLQNQ